LIFKQRDEMVMQVKEEMMDSTVQDHVHQFCKNSLSSILETSFEKKQTEWNTNILNLTNSQIKQELMNCQINLKEELATNLKSFAIEQIMKELNKSKKAQEHALLCMDEPLPTSSRQKKIAEKRVTTSRAKEGGRGGVVETTKQNAMYPDEIHAITTCTNSSNSTDEKIIDSKRAKIHSSTSNKKEEKKKTRNTNKRRKNITNGVSKKKTRMTTRLQQRQNLDAISKQKIFFDNSNKSTNDTPKLSSATCTMETKKTSPVTTKVVHKVTMKTKPSTRAMKITPPVKSLVVPPLLILTSPSNKLLPPPQIVTEKTQKGRRRRKAVPVKSNKKPSLMFSSSSTITPTTPTNTTLCLYNKSNHNASILPNKNSRQRTKKTIKARLNTDNKGAILNTTISPTQVMARKKCIPPLWDNSKNDDSCRKALFSSLPSYIKSSNGSKFNALPETFVESNESSHNEIVIPSTPDKAFNISSSTFDKRTLLGRKIGEDEGGLAISTQICNTALALPPPLTIPTPQIELSLFRVKKRRKKSVPRPSCQSIASSDPFEFF